MLRLSALFIMALALAACQSDDLGADRAVTGLAASRPPTAETDAARDLQAEKRAYSAPIGQQLTWNNPDTGDSGTVTAVRDSYDSTGAYCRDLRQTSVIGGQAQQSSGRACQQADGSWKNVP